MATWILILTAALNGYSVNVESVQGFTSSEACQAAGQVWEQNLPSRVSGKFVCVPQSK